MGKPINTLYRLATSQDDYFSCVKLEKELNLKLYPFGYPTVVAERDGEIIGFLGTSKSGIIGPLVVQDESPFTMVRLIEAYENFLRFNGVTRYIFQVEKSNNHWLKMIKRGTGMEPFDEDETDFWFERRLAS